MVALNKSVVARTRVAELVLATPDLLSRYVAGGGLRKDLESIRDHGLHAEAMNSAQALATKDASGATVATLITWAGVQREYKNVMAVLTAVRADLAEAGAPADVIKKVDGILKDETAVFIATTTDGTAKAKKSARLEAVRTEIRNDVDALLAFPEVLPLLAARKVDTLRLKELLAASERVGSQLKGKQSATDKRSGATAAEHAATELQDHRWRGSRRLLAAVADHSESLRALMRVAGSRR